jgi:gliding motility-associated-like protein
MTILMSENTPWNNKQYVIYRKNSDADCLPNTSSFDSITTVTSNFYTDYGLINGNNYWYLVKTIGEYDLNYIPKPIINYSQEICVSPQDITPPCAVNLALESDCDLFKNYLTWSVNESCAEDIDNFLIFYSNSLEGPFQLIDTVFDNTQRNYVHSPEVSLGACYVVSAQDSAGNYIKPENLIRSCIDDCSYYELPNVFTPNADGLNDLFIPYPYKFVEKIDMTIYNRWGSPVFTTNNPDINWNGIDSETNRPVSDGVYYYICDVYEKRLSGIVVRNLSGTIRIFANSGNKRQN